jgi:hypothetical protein
MACSRHIGEKDADLTILDVASGPTVLHLHTCRLAAALGKAGLVNAHDGIVRAQLLQDIATQVVTHQIGIPNGTGEQTLHARGGGFSGLLGQLPAIFALEVTEQSLQVPQHAATGFGSGKARGDAGMQLP